MRPWVAAALLLDLESMEESVYREQVLAIGQIRIRFVGVACGSMPRLLLCLVSCQYTAPLPLLLCHPAS